MTTQEKINKIHHEYYNNFNGSLLYVNKNLHSELRNFLGDDEYLIYLENIIKENPKPIYKIPDGFYNMDL